jgi:hypothetical protein
LGSRLYRSAWGFGSSVSLEEAPRVAELAIEIAKGSAPCGESETYDSQSMRPVIWRKRIVRCRRPKQNGAAP